MPIQTLNMTVPLGHNRPTRELMIYSTSHFTVGVVARSLDETAGPREVTLETLDFSGSPGDPGKVMFSETFILPVAGNISLGSINLQGHPYRVCIKVEQPAEVAVSVSAFCYNGDPVFVS